MSTYKINQTVGGQEVEIEAQSYELQDGFFHFFDAVGAGRKKIASVDANMVSVLQKDDSRTS